ncbi:MAG: dihydropteroate synthase [Planctomycetes bacterium]|nr:dihydropteroate synthase [Planctomycetota bacterium]
MTDILPRILFVTGQLAEPSLRRMVGELGPQAGFEPEVAVLKITVAALMTPKWVAARLEAPAGIDRVLLPGYCTGDLKVIGDRTGLPVERGPKDLLDLPEYFGQSARRLEGIGGFDIEILAEINHAPKLGLDRLLEAARHYRTSGADVIDLGGVPGEPWPGFPEAVRALRGEGFRVSIDSLDPGEVGPAVRAGAELVLSVNSTNLDAARDWGCEVVAIPDDPKSLRGLDSTVERLDAWKVPFRMDPILEPIAFGFAESLGRYLDVRRRYPHAELMMGIGNLSELTEVDSAGINLLLAGFCQEVGIRSVLTTEVINWARSSVREMDVARRMVYHACRHGVLPKHLGPSLVLLRDPKVHEYGAARLEELASQIRDRNYRIFGERGEIHVLNSEGYLHGTDPFDLFRQMPVKDSSHAFYLGYEMAKAMTALALHKDYRQDQALEWGFLTREENRHPVRPES